MVELRTWDMPYGPLLAKGHDLPQKTRLESQIVRQSELYMPARQRGKGGEGYPVPLMNPGTDLLVCAPVPNCSLPPSSQDRFSLPLLGKKSVDFAQAFSEKEGLEVGGGLASSWGLRAPPLPGPADGPEGRCEGLGALLNTKVHRAETVFWCDLVRARADTWSSTAAENWSSFGRETRGPFFSMS